MKRAVPSLWAPVELIEKTAAITMFVRWGRKMGTLLSLYQGLKHQNPEDVTVNVLGVRCLTSLAEKTRRRPNPLHFLPHLWVSSSIAYNVFTPPWIEAE